MTKSKCMSLGERILRLGFGGALLIWSWHRGQVVSILGIGGAVVAFTGLIAFCPTSACFRKCGRSGENASC